MQSLVRFAARCYISWNYPPFFRNCCRHPILHPILYPTSIPIPHPAATLSHSYHAFLSPFQGGGLYIQSGTVVLVACSVFENTATNVLPPHPICTCSVCALSAPPARTSSQIQTLSSAVSGFAQGPNVYASSAATFCLFQTELTAGISGDVDSCAAPPPSPLAPPWPSPSLPPPTSPVAGPIASLTGDPHTVGAHGDRSDLRGEDRAIYVVLSDRNVSFAVQMEHHSFRTTHSKLTVNGSWARAAYWVLRTTSKRRLIDVSFQAKYPRKAILTELDGNGTELLQDAPPLVIDNLHLHLKRKKLTVQTGRWRMSAESTVGYPHPNQLRLNIKIQPTHQDWLDVVAPHGILGQTYDRDNMAVDGERDSYAHLDDGRATVARTHAGGIITTRSNAQGGIEGQLSDYRISGRFKTWFRFSRFDSIAAAPRNISKLAGRKRPIRNPAY